MLWLLWFVAGWLSLQWWQCGSFRQHSSEYAQSNSVAGELCALMCVHPVAQLIYSSPIPCILFSIVWAVFYIRFEVRSHLHVVPKSPNPREQVPLFVLSWVRRSQFGFLPLRAQFAQKKRSIRNSPQQCVLWSFDDGPQIASFRGVCALTRALTPLPAGHPFLFSSPPRQHVRTLLSWLIVLLLVCVRHFG